MAHLLIVYVPVTHADAVRQALANAGAGKLGHYDSCSFSTRGTGRFRALKGAKPFIGKENIIEEVAEERIEVLVPTGIDPHAVMTAVKKVHPYEEPAYVIVEAKN